VRKILALLLTAGIACLLNLQNLQAQVVGHLPEYLPRFKLIVRFQASAIYDQTSEALLLGDYYNARHRYDLASQVLSIIGPIPQFSAAVLIPNGYINYTTNGLLQIEGSEQLNLGPAEFSSYDFGIRSREGRFGVLRFPEGRVLRDFVARTNLLISPVDGFTDVSGNGTVAFTEMVNETNIAVRVFRNGTFETLALLPHYPIPHIATDGTNVLWGEPESYVFGSIFLQTPTERILLSTNTSIAESGPPPQFPPRAHSVAMKNGWTIFPRRGPGNPGSIYNLWRRSPTGEMDQLTTSPAFVYAMDDNGAVLRSAGENDEIGGLIYDPPHGNPKPLGLTFGGSLARFFASGNKFYAYSPLQSGGSGLFEIQIDSDPFGMVFPSFSSETGKFTFALIPGTVGSYILERTVDFIEWTPIHTIDVQFLEGLLVEVTTSPGFFRVRRP